MELDPHSVRRGPAQASPASSFAAPRSAVASREPALARWTGTRRVVRPKREELALQTDSHASCRSQECACGTLLAGGLTLTYSIPSSETSFEETFSWWQDNRGQHQISGLLLAPLVALMLIFFGAGLQRSLRSGNRDSGHGSVAFGGAILGAAGFALIGELEGAATNAAHEGHQEAVYALSQLHSYDWLAFNAAWAAVLLATGLGARRNGMLPNWLAWATIVLGATQLTLIGPSGRSSSRLVDRGGVWLFRRESTSTEPVGLGGENVALTNPRLALLDLPVARARGSVGRELASRAHSGRVRSY